LSLSAANGGECERCQGSNDHGRGHFLTFVLSIESFHQRQGKFDGGSGPAAGEAVAVHYYAVLDPIPCRQLIDKARVAGGLVPR